MIDFHCLKQTLINIFDCNLPQLNTEYRDAIINTILTRVRDMEKEEKPQREQLKTIITYYRPRNQILKAIEELTELTEVLIKSVNKGFDMKNLIDELADVYIMSEQIKMIYEIDALELDNHITEKIERQLNRINGGTT